MNKYKFIKSKTDTGDNNLWLFCRCRRRVPVPYSWLTSERDESEGSVRSLGEPEEWFNSNRNAARVYFLFVFKFFFYHECGEVKSGDYL